VSPHSKHQDRSPAQWRFRDTGQEVNRHIGRPKLQGKVLERILAARGFQAEEIPTYLTPSLSELSDPFLLKDMKPAVERLTCAIRNKEPLVVYGDYDADGATATSLLLRVFRHLEAKADFYIPNRLEEGYGLNIPALEGIAATGARLVVTVDTGISGLEASEAAQKLGLDLIITDHHQPGPVLPRALAVVNPNRPDCTSPTPGLAGVGVAFKLAHALLKEMNHDPASARMLLASLLELVAIGSIADFAPLTGENRVMVRHGLERLRRTESLGLRALFRVAGVKDSQRPISASEIGFQIGPRLNAAGRTQDAGICVELLTTHDAKRAEEIASELDRCNRDRRRIELQIVEECLELLEMRPDLLGERVIVLSQPGWHPGVIGIVAARILQKYWRPTLILTEEDGKAKGSARSIPGYDIFRALSGCGQLLEKYGGHPAAAGLTLDAQLVPQLRKSLNDHAQQVLMSEDLVPQVLVDALVGIDELNENLVEQLAAMEPFGQRNPEPVLALFHAELVEPPRVVKNKHMRLVIKTPAGPNLYAIGWNMTAKSSGIDDRTRWVDVAFLPFLSDYSETASVELRLKAVRPSEAPNHG
jgi:single-stranded-DNA-specific exonuclease